MSNWIPITADDVATKLAGEELKAAREAALGDGQIDPLPDVIEEVVQEVRGYVGTVYTLSAGLTIPQKLRGAALVLIRDRLLSRFPTSSLSTEDRRAQVQAAYQLLRDVASRRFQVDAPDSPVDNEVASGASVECIGSSISHFSRHSLNGL
jgi:hypothetical protein